MKSIIIGSRGSDLALWQANYIKGKIENLGFTCVIQIIETKGDQIQNVGFSKMEGKGFFTKEIEEALLEKKIDIAVHSHKDLETTQPSGLTIAAVTQRAAPEDVILILKSAVDERAVFEFKQQAIVGTSSARRKAQMKFHRPDAKLEDLRGNVPTRIQKLRDGNYDAIILAKAGLDRLEIDLSEFHVHVCEPEIFVPAPAQGALGLQCRIADESTIQLLSNLNHSDTSDCIFIERSVLAQMNGGCQLPLGVYAQKHINEYVVHVAYANSSESETIYYSLRNETQIDAIHHVLKLLKEE
ncbi:MAG: hydroxymethylbilane synthase [Bacteroidota bacterium]